MIRLIQELAAAGFPVVVACRVLKVPSSTYYEAINRQPSDRAVADAALIESIVEIHADSHGTYGHRKSRPNSGSVWAFGWAVNG